MAVQLGGKVALITGASSGIGAACARLMAWEGAAVGVMGRSEDETNKVVEEIHTAGGTAMPLIGDVSSPDDMERLTRTLGEHHGRIDVVVANAGINGTWAPLDVLTPDDWDQTLDINLKGTFLTVRYSLPYLKRQGGAVVVVSSVNGTRMFSNTGATAYACSKAGQVAFVKMTAIELAQNGIRINVVCPGAIETNIDENTEKKDVERVSQPVEYPEGEIPLTDGKPGSAEQVAQLIAFLASDRASHITGTEVWIDGGQSLLQG